MSIPRATLVGRLGGRPVYRIPVRVHACNPLGDLNAMLGQTVAEIEVLSHSPAEAAEWAREHVARWQPHTQCVAYGPRGGSVSRHVSFEGYIAHELMLGRSPSLSLF